MFRCFWNWPWFGRKHRNNTLTLKRFSSGVGFWCLGGAAAKNYREKSVDVSCYDELSSFEPDVEKEGSPTLLGDKRIEGSVWPKSIRGSTPKAKGTCQIDKAANESAHFMRFHSTGYVRLWRISRRKYTIRAYSSAALSVIPNADGGVYRSAGLSQYSGSIVNRPTFFAFARGAAVMERPVRRLYCRFVAVLTVSWGLWQQVPEGWRCLHRSIILQSATRGRNDAAGAEGGL